MIELQSVALLLSIRIDREGPRETIEAQEDLIKRRFMYVDIGGVWRTEQWKTHELVRFSYRRPTSREPKTLKNTVHRIPSSRRKKTKARQTSMGPPLDLPSTVWKWGKTLWRTNAYTYSTRESAHLRFYI